MVFSEPAYEESRSWAEVGKLLIILTSVIAVRNCFGVFFPSIENQFALSRGATSAFFSAFNALSTIFTILSGWAFDRFGSKAVLLAMSVITLLGLFLTGQVTSSWQLFFTYSLLLAAGTSGGFLLVLSTVSKLFVKRRGLALGIALSGEGLGTLAGAPLAAFLISSYSWRTAFSILGLIAASIIISFGLFLKKVPHHSELANGQPSTGSRKNECKSIQSSGFSIKEALKTGSFWFLGAVYLLFSLSFYLVLTHIVPHAYDMGISPARAVLIISLIGGTTIPGRLVIGWASDKTGIKLLAISCALFQSAAMLWLAWSNSLWMFYLFAVIFGFTFGGLSNLMASLISDTFGLTNLGAITGALVVGFSLGAAIGPALGGFIFDTTHSYFLSFLMGSVSGLMAALFLALTKREVKTGLLGTT